MSNPPVKIKEILSILLEAIGKRTETWNETKSIISESDFLY